MGDTYRVNMPEKLIHRPIEVKPRGRIVEWLVVGKGSGIGIEFIHTQIINPPIFVPYGYQIKFTCEIVPNEECVEA